MQSFLSNIALQINPNIYIKNPETSPLGKRILSQAITLIAEDGFDRFTFRRLASSIESTEASVYRYFENKHNLLAYLVAWYWQYIDCKLVLSTVNVIDKKEQLKRVLDVVVGPMEEDGMVPHINEELLETLVVRESSKAYLTTEVDKENKEGFFLSYKGVVDRVSGLISEINSEYPYPRALVSTLFETIHLQRFFAAHLPRLTDANTTDELKSYCMHLIKSAINTNE